MIAHVDALCEWTRTLFPSYGWRAPMSAPVQIFVWQTPAWGAGEASLCGPGESLSTDVRLTARAELGGAVSVMLDRARRQAMVPLALSVPGRSVTVQWVRSEFVAPDLDIVLPETNTSPFYGIDTYRLVSEAI